MMRNRVFTPPFVLLFALLNLLIGADLNSPALLLIAGIVALASASLLLHRLLRNRRVVRLHSAAPPSAPARQRALSSLGTAAIVLVAASGEWIVLHVAMDPWVEPAPGPVRGEIRASGSDFGKGVRWSPDLCRPATNPGVTAAALMEKDEPYPVAWIIGRPNGGIAAIDVQPSGSVSTVRFYPVDCTRLHGDVRLVHALAGTAGLTGYADAECIHGSDALTIHVDFNACAAMPFVPLSGPPSGRTASAQ